MLSLACAATILTPTGNGALSHYRPRGDSFGLPGVATNLSGITYRYDTGTWFLVRNSNAIVYEYDAGLTGLLRKLRLVGGPSNDYEAIVYLGNAEFMIADETNHAVIVRMPEDRDTRVLNVNPARDDVQGFELPRRGAWNSGIEGLCFVPGSTSASGTFYALQESRPRRVYRFERPAHGDDVSVFDGTLVVVEPFDAEAVFERRAQDLSGCHYDERTRHLLITSHESSLLVEVTLDGRIVDSLPLEGLLHGGASQYEGVAIGEGGVMVVVSEPLLGTTPSRARLYDFSP